MSSLMNYIRKTDQISPERLRDLLQDLVDIYSPSGKEEEVLKYTTKYLRRSGLHPIRQEVDENRYNLIILPEDEDDIKLCFVGHLDTITAYDIENYEFQEDNGNFYGLGTVDMKSGCAAMIEAFTVLAARQKDTAPVALALVIGEEEDSDGAKALVREYSFPWAIVGEPTNMLPCLSHYGYLEVLLRTKGKRAHSSMPELGHNAIETMLKLLLQFTDYSASMPHGLVYNIRDLSGFPGGFVVPDTCEAWLDLHIPPDSRIDGLRAEIENVVMSASQHIPFLDSYIRFEETYSGYRISPDRPLVRKIKEVYEETFSKWEPQEFRSHSDANVLWSAGVDPIILGPGRLEAAHSPDECVAFTQVVEAAHFYLQLASSM